MYGLIGYPLSHSFSPAFFAEKFRKLGLQKRYDLYPLKSIDKFRDLLLKQPGLQGLNITIPYKQKIIPYLDAVSPAAEAIKAVNCIEFRKGKLIGHNTDVWGFEFSLIPYLPKKNHQALIFGTGGSSKAVCYVFDLHQIPYRLVSTRPREEMMAYSELNEHMLEQFTILVNTTPIGMHPKVDQVLPLPFDSLSKRHFLFDLVYNPMETQFLKEGRIRGAECKNGLEMLYLQAEKSWHIWNSKDF